MVLILEVTSANASELGTNVKKVFGLDGGLIGRDRNSEWVLPQPKISNRHAVISFQNGIFYIEDTSTNGVFINSSRSRLVRGRPYALKAGDYILIDPYVIQVSISSEIDEGSIQPPSRSAPMPAFSTTDAFNIEDPFGERRADQPLSPEVTPHPQSGQEVDPLKLLDAGPSAPPSRSVPRAQDLDEGSALHGHYQPPAVAPSSASRAEPDPFVIPADYDPLSPDSFHPGVRPRPRAVPPPPAPVERAPEPPAPAIAPEPAPVPATPPAPPPPAPAVEPERPVAASPPAPPVERLPPFDLIPPAAAPSKVRTSPSNHPNLFDKVLEGAGLPPDVVTPEVAQNFGKILRVVVEGVMEILRARQEIKDEFRMRMTQFRPADNNPLKFSANVDDALHNLLVKRNAAYLGAVEAFEDAFDDLRNHQIAMLSGMRTAFESMLAAYDPDKLQEQFDRQVKRASLFVGPAKLRYWDLYRDRQEELVRDPERTFQKLFGEIFAKAYEEQLERLRSKDRGVDD